MCPKRLSVRILFYEQAVYELGCKNGKSLHDINVSKTYHVNLCLLYCIMARQETSPCSIYRDKKACLLHLKNRDERE